MRLILRIALFNFLHLPVMLLANLFWGLFMTFVTKEVGQDMESLNILSRLFGIVFLSILSAFTVVPQVILFTIVAIQIISVVSFALLKLYLKGGSVVGYSGLITVLALFPYYYVMCYNIMNTPLLFWFSYPLFVWLEWVKYKKYSTMAGILEQKAGGQIPKA